MLVDENNRAMVKWVDIHKNIKVIDFSYDVCEWINLVVERIYPSSNISKGGEAQGKGGFGTSVAPTNGPFVLLDGLVRR